jgi:hypothetical protein
VGPRPHIHFPPDLILYGNLVAIINFCSSQLLSRINVVIAITVAIYLNHSGGNVVALNFWEQKCNILILSVISNYDRVADPDCYCTLLGELSIAFIISYKSECIQRSLK